MVMDQGVSTIAQMLMQYGFTPLGDGRYVSPQGQLVTEEQALAMAQGGQQAAPQQAASPATQMVAQQQQAQAQAQVAGMTQDMSVQQQNLQFLREKHAFEQSEGLKTEARQTQQQIFTQQYQVASMQNQIDQFNSRQNVDVQQQNFDNSERYATRQQNLATQIGTLAQDAGDRGKYASTVLANGDWGADNSQTDYRTDESLMPLNQLLRIRSNSMGGPAPLTQERVGMPNMQAGAGLDLNAAMPPTAAGPTLPAQAAPAYNPYADINAVARSQNATGDNFSGFNVGANATVPGVPASAPAPADQPGYSDADMIARILASRAAGSGSGGDLPRMAGGGIEDEAYISGEAGPELNIPLANGKAVVLNADQLESLGINLKSVMKMAGGGIFDSMANKPDTSLAQDFLRQASTNARSNTPWAGGGNLPSPVYGAAPGFDPIVLDLMASMNALERGYPAAAYKRQAALLTPAGVNEHAVRRTA